MREIEPERMAELDEDGLLPLHKGAKSRLRAEEFEEALALVSARLADRAHQEAEQLKAERLALAKARKSSGPATKQAGGSKVAAAGPDKFR